MSHWCLAIAKAHACMALTSKHMQMPGSLARCTNTNRIRDCSNAGLKWIGGPSPWHRRSRFEIETSSDICPFYLNFV